MNTNNKTTPTELAWQRKDGTGPRFTVGIAKLPESSRFILMQRGFTHILGNEAAVKDETDRDDWRRERIEALVDGTFAVREQGPRLPTRERLAREISLSAIVAIAKRDGWSGVQAKIGTSLKEMPKAADKESWNALHDLWMAKFAKWTEKQVDEELAKRQDVKLPDFEEDAEEAA